MKKYCTRWIQPLLQRKVKEHSAVILTGARQVGKTTLLKEEFPDWHYLTLDDYNLVSQLKKDPEFILTSRQPLILDEIQRMPELFITLKKVIDENRGFHFLLSGSAQLLLMEKISESLAGRAVFLELGPMTQGEMLGLPVPSFLENLLKGDFSSIDYLYPPCDDLSFRAWHGGMPQIYQRNQLNSIIEWFEGYLTTYLEKDLRQLSQIDNLTDFRQLMIASALRNGNIMNISEMGRDIGLKQPTAHRYVNLLEVSSLIFRLPAYSVSRGKRLVKSPKIMWFDSGLAAYLSGHYSPEGLEQSREWGGILECFAFQQLKQLTLQLTPKPHLYYWRTAAGNEVDFVIEQGQTLLAIEINSGRRVNYQDTLNLQQFIEEYPTTKAGIILYGGHRVEQFAKNIFALPLSALWHPDQNAPFA